MLQIITRAMFVVLLALGGSEAFAQSSMGTVSGTVTDSSGAVIPGATVTLTSLDTDDRRDARQRRQRPLHLRQRAARHL